MKHIILFSIISGLSFITFIALVTGGILKKSRNLLIAGVLFAVLAFCSGLYSGYNIVTKSYQKVDDLLRPRTGKEIYVALFGEPQANCVKIIDYKDQQIPKIDCAIWLHFKTCPEELKRILSKRDFEAERVSSKGWNSTEPLPNDNWFKPELLGDTIFVYKYLKDEFGNGQTIYANMENDEVYCVDVLD